MGAVLSSGWNQLHQVWVSDLSPARSVLEKVGRETETETVYLVYVACDIHVHPYMAFLPVFLAMYHGNILVIPPIMKFSVYSR